MIKDIVTDIVNRYALFEVNDMHTREVFKTQLHCALIQRRIYDPTCVICDGTNNTPERIDRNEFHASIIMGNQDNETGFVQYDVVVSPLGVEISP